MGLFGEIALASGHPDAAEALRAARDGFRARGQRLYEGYLGAWIAAAERDLGELASAEALLDAAGARFWGAHARVVRAGLYEALGDALAAGRAAEEAGARLDAMGLGAEAPLRRRLAAVSTPGR